LEIELAELFRTDVVRRSDAIQLVELNSWSANSWETFVSAPADFIFDGIESGRIPLVHRISARARVRLPGRVD
jgi:hypothetical protein